MALDLIDPEAVPGSTSISDKAIVGYLNETRQALNDLAASLSTRAPTATVAITDAQAATLNGLPVGTAVVLVDPSGATTTATVL